MFSLLPRKVSPKPLLSSRLFDERSFYQAFIKDLRGATCNVVIESPYITMKRVNELEPILRQLVGRNVQVRINTRNPKCHDEYLRLQAWLGINRLKLLGVTVRFFNDFRHRKVAIIDNEVLWEGSLNILSQNNSREIMRRTVSPELCKQMIYFTGMNRWFW